MLASCTYLLNHFWTLLTFLDVSTPPVRLGRVKKVEKVPKAAEALRLTSKDMSKNKLVDDVIKEPLDGAHRSEHLIYERVKKYIKKAINELEAKSPEERINSRIDKFNKMGVWKH